MLCRSCRRQLSRNDEVCGVCGAPVPGRQPPALELVLSDGRRFPVAGAVTIGRGPDNTIQLAEQTVSRHHARVLADGGVPGIEDAGSTYGTFVDGRKVDGRTPLRDGASIRVGDAELRVEARRAETASGRTVVFGAVPAALAGQDLESGPLLRPRLRKGSALKRLEAEEGDLRFILRDPEGRFVRMTAADADLLGLIDGETSLPDLIVAAGAHFGADGPGRLASLLADLGERGMLEGVEKAEAPAPKGILRRTFRTRQVSFTWAGPVFERVYRAGGWLLFTRPALIAVAAVAVSGLLAFAYLIAGNHVTPFVVASRVGLGGLVFLVGRFLVVIVHEFAHGLTVASFGRKVPKAGLKLMLIFPYAYVDTSEAWFEPARRRIAISGAGPVSDLTIGGGAALATAFVHAGTLRDVFFQLSLAAYTGAIFNLNPLLDRDGYHIVVDVLREPGLRHRSRAWLAERLSGQPTAEADASVLATYSITALAWSLATAAFTIVMSQRYYSYLTALAPVWVVWTVLIAFYVLMFVPILAVFFKAYATRRSNRAEGADGAVA